MSVFSSKKTQQGVYAAEVAKERTQTESKQKACMGMEMPDFAIDDKSHKLFYNCSVRGGKLP